jgi:hypothetical protein
VTACLAQSDRASDSYGGLLNIHLWISEGCEFDPRGGLIVYFFFLLFILLRPSVYLIVIRIEPDIGHVSAYFD